MKFCYADESGMGAEPFLVMTGVIVDAQRMHVTKDDWSELLARLSKTCGRELKELHMREMYRGNGPWHGVDGQERARLTIEILDWWIERKHDVTFTAIDKAAYAAAKEGGKVPDGCGTPWRTAALHLALTIQRHFNSTAKNKGHTLLLFDREAKEEQEISRLISSPPPWTDLYYVRAKKRPRLDQIIDVPFFGDSEQVLLLQVADLIAYLLRHYAELEQAHDKERYAGERDAVRAWVRRISSRALPQTTRWPKKGRSAIHDFYESIAPKSLLALHESIPTAESTELGLGDMRRLDLGVPSTQLLTRRPPARVAPSKRQTTGAPDQRTSPGGVQRGGTSS